MTIYAWVPLPGYATGAVIPSNHAKAAEWVATGHAGDVTDPRAAVAGSTNIIKRAWDEVKANGG